MIPAVLPTYNRAPLSFVRGEGSWLVADPVTGTAAVFLSVLDNADGYLSSYYPPIIALLAEAATAA